MGKTITDEIQASVVMQSFWRGHQVRKKFVLVHAEASDLTAHATFLIGNDPKIKNLEPYATKVGKIALVGTSGLRSLELVCELGNKEHLPKLIIVDNSAKVISFWRLMRAWATTYVPMGKGNFIQDFKFFLIQNNELYSKVAEDGCTRFNRPGIEYESQNPLLFMNRVIEKHGLHYVLAIIRHTSIIGQTWADNRLFVSLKNILSLNGIETIYAYSSNIEACIRKSNVQNLANSIKILDPALSIHTDLNLKRRIPEFVKFNLGTALKKRKQSELIESKSLIAAGVEFLAVSYLNFLGLLSYKQPQEEEKLEWEQYPGCV